MARRAGLNVRELARRVGGYSGLQMVGTPTDIAGEMEQWLDEDGSDDFNVMFPLLPASLDYFLAKVVPETAAARHLQAGIRRRDTARASESAETAQSLLRKGDVSR
ncbi:hypothetical protein [Caballeronia sp. BCC1704]|uniref:hypothetical protein n=1 Tax=Caballeronia sp. BCC1704 TaxID=2676300 RepID=UPI001FC8198D|nr:hypothetical protein [Caballeronia sp. BCC1704]